MLPSCLWRPRIRHVSGNVVKNAEPMIVIGHLKQQTPTKNNLLIENFKPCDANKQHSPTSERQSTWNVAIPPTYSYLQLVDPKKIHWLQNRVEPFHWKNLYDFMLKPFTSAQTHSALFLSFLMCSSPLPTCCAHINPLKIQSLQKTFQDDLPEAKASIPEPRSNYTAPAAKIPKLLHLGLLHDHPCVAVEWTHLWTHVLICTWHDLFDMRTFITDLVVLKKAWSFWIDDLGCWFFDDGNFWRQSVYSSSFFVVLSKTKVDHLANHRAQLGFLSLVEYL